MLKTTRERIAWMLREYEDRTGKSSSRVAADIGLTHSMYYLYRDGRGNPGGDTANKIEAYIRENAPDILSHMLRERLAEVEAGSRGRPVLV